MGKLDCRVASMNFLRYNYQTMKLLMIVNSAILFSLHGVDPVYPLVDRIHSIETMQ